MTPAQGGPNSWRRLSPLSPVVRIGGIPVVGVFYILGQLGHNSSRGNDPSALIGGAVVSALAVIGGVVSWMVTRWRINGSDLQIELGLIRRQSLRIPLERIQAVDVVSPLLARVFGLAEVRVISAGRGAERSRLAYLPATEAQAVRAQLLALAHGLDASVQEPAAVHLMAVSNGQLIVSTLLRAPILPLAVAAILTTVVLAVVPGGSGGGAAVAFSFVPTVLLLAVGFVNADWDFRVSEAPDGFRLDRGLLQTRHETIPFGRIQAIRMVQPLLWRFMGWCRLEVDVARQKVSRRVDSGEAAVARALIPITTLERAAWLISRAAPGANLTPSATSGVPRRAWFVMPLSYHFAAAWSDSSYVYSRTGRVCARTVAVPHQKTQSVRLLRGPLRRLFGLTDLFVDTAGQRWSVQARSRDADESNALVWHWTELAEQRRQSEKRVSLR